MGVRIYSPLLSALYYSGGARDVWRSNAGGQWPIGSLKGLIFDTRGEAIQAISPETPFVECTARVKWGLE